MITLAERLRKQGDTHARLDGDVGAFRAGSVRGRG
jgi:hypothetical protein